MKGNFKWNFHESNPNSCFALALVLHSSWEHVRKNLLTIQRYLAFTVNLSSSQIRPCNYSSNQCVVPKIGNENWVVLGRCWCYPLANGMWEWYWVTLIRNRNRSYLWNQVISSSQNQGQSNGCSLCVLMGLLILVDKERRFSWFSSICCDS